MAVVVRPPRVPAATARRPAKWTAHARSRKNPSTHPKAKAPTPKAIASLQGNATLWWMFTAISRITRSPLALASLLPRA